MLLLPLFPPGTLTLSRVYTAQLLCQCVRPVQMKANTSAIAGAIAVANAVATVAKVSQGTQRDEREQNRTREEERKSR